MSEQSEQDALRIAFEAALAARQETFLAHLPRKLKLFVLAALLAALSLPLWTALKGTEKVLHTAAEQMASSAPAEGLAPKTAHPSQTLDAMTAQAYAERGKPKNEYEAQAIARNDDAVSSFHMIPAPDAGLVETTAGGGLPKIGSDGRQPWQVYARPFDRADPRPRIALVMGNLGLSRVATDAALRRLPPTITLAFDAQGDSLGAWLDRARQDGHETLLSAPMEPVDYPRNDPGPGSLLTALPNSDNVSRFLDMLRKGSGYIGVTTLTGSRFIADGAKMQPIIQALHDRGLMILDSHASQRSAIRELAVKSKTPVAVSARTIDTIPSPQDIDAALAQLEQTARVEGHVVAMASPYPVTLERIELWEKHLADKGLVLAPLSAVTE